MNDFNSFLTYDFIHAIGWTILHSLWQITLVALLFRIVLTFLKNNSSRIRYNVSVGALLIVLVMSATTFMNEYSNSTTEHSNINNSQLSEIEYNLNENIEDRSDSAVLLTMAKKFKSFFNRNMVLIVIAWNICVFALFLKMLGGLAYSQRMKRSRTFALPEHINKRLTQLANLVGVKKSIQIMESAIVNVPIVIGYFKPVILLPVGIMTGLSSDQIEAIIKHELAHIKRNDYLINIFQSMIEILFFFHPSIWFISNTIRNERESACDEIVMANNTSRISLAKALTNIEIINHKKIEYAMAFTRNKYTLLNRLKRIVNQQKKRYTFKEGFITVFIIVVGLTIMSFSAKLIINSNDTQNVKQANELVETMDKPVLINSAISIPDKSTLSESSINTKKLHEFTMNKLTVTDDTIVKTIKDNQIEYSVNGVVYSLFFEKDKTVTKFLINNKEIPKTDWNKYDKEIKLGFYLKERHEKVMKEHEKNMEKHEIDMVKHEKAMAEFEKQMEKYEPELEKLEEHMVEFEKQMQKHKPELEELEMHKAEFEKQMQKHMQEHESNMVIHEKAMVEFEKQMEKHEIEMKKHETEMKKHKEKHVIIQELIEEMKKDKLIDKDAKSYSLSFTGSELKINDKKQSKEVFEKYKKLFESKSKGKIKIDKDFSFDISVTNK